MKKNYFTSGLPMIITKTVYLLLVMSFLISISSYSQITKTFTSSGTLEVPAGVTTLSVQTWGAGGGGGGSNELLTLVSLGAAGGGGGGGAYSAATIPVIPVPANAQFNYTVGQGGAGGSLENINGLDGGTSTFSTISAGGGKGGGGGILLSGAGAGQGSIVGDFKGGNGGSTYLVLIDLSNIFDIKLGINRSGGGGGSAGPGSVGANASSLTGGSALVDGGAGGNGGEKKLLASLVSTSNVKGLPGSLPGGGGGGGVGKGLVNGVLDFTENNSNGGKGGNGQIKVTYTCSTYNISSLTPDANCAQTSTITLHSTPERLPIGTYAVTYNRSFPLATGLTATMVVSIKGTGTIDVVGLPIEGLSMITITKLESVDCSSTVNASITFNRPVKPAVDAVTHPSCAEPKGKVVLSGLVIGGMIHQTGISTRSYQITAAVQTITGLDSGTYNFVVSNGVCSSKTVSAITSVIINNPPSFRTWNGSWDVVPTIENKVIFESNYDKDESVEACSCEVKSGSHVTFKTGKYLKIRNELVVNPAGSLTFENNASLVQMNDGAVNLDSGVITYKRHTMPVKRYDYTYWSSPVKGQTLKKLSPNTLGDKYYSYNPLSGWELHYNGNKEMMPGEGYIIRAPQKFEIDKAKIDDNPVFLGKPNNGIISKYLSGGQLYLLGNPYPSALDANAFLAENASKLDGTLYFWTHNSPPSDNVPAYGEETTKYNYTTNDYAAYNRSGGVATHPAVEDDDENDPNNNNNFNVPNGNIAAAQGFFAYASSVGGELIFNNSMRFVTNVDNEEEVMDNSQFFKVDTASKTTTTIEKNRVWLNLTNNEGAFKQTLVGYISGATNDYEGNFDGVSFDGNEFVDFYSVNQGVNLSIQGRSLPFQQKDSVALGYRSAIKGEFQISIDQKDGKLANQQVFLEDKLVQVLHDLKRPYSFGTEVGIFNDRFVLRYEDKNAIIEDIVDAPVTAVSISTKDKNIKLTTTESVIDKVYIYDFSGGLVYSDSEINATATVVSNLLIDHSALIVHVILENGKKTVKKIMY